MSIKQTAPEVWSLDVRVYSGAKQFRIREQFKGGQKAAKARYQEIRANLLERAATEPRSFSVSRERLSTFSGVLDFYLERNNVGSNKHYFDRLKADLGNIPLDLLADRFDLWLQFMRQTKSDRTDRKLTPATVNRFIAWSKAAFNFAVSYKAIQSNPIEHIKKTKEIPRDIALNDIEKANLFNVLEREAPYLVPLVRFAIVVPCRTGELLQMRRDDLDLFNNAIRVRCGVMKNKELATWKPIPESMKEYFSSIASVSEYLFPRQEGEQYKQIKVFPYELFRRCLKLAGLSGWRLHDARHEAVSSLLNNGTPEQVVTMVAGWTSSAMLRTYYHRDGLQTLKMVRFSEKQYTVRVETAQAV